ncbi:serine kinase [Dyella sp. 2HG41-7]|uniref:serine kinase n=1 Tax=Dyella sp. 2HG41-7 TaxID=2883239 RepID=UPI001F45C7B3|nr:serine kinase [Dyella sp. 2HG41-7]
MALNFPRDASAVATDPFGERRRYPYVMTKAVLGARFRFESTSVALLDLVEAAYGGLPPYAWADTSPEFRIELRLQHRAPCYGNEPPPVQMQSGGGALCGVVDASNYVVMVPGEHRAVIVATDDMLAHAYHLRYELIEFAVFTLATRGLGLVPLHGACIGLGGRGLLLLGASGAGKSTLALHCLLQGFDVLAEDAVFVRPDHRFAVGVSNYLHVQADALALIDDDDARRWIGGSPVIRRRSGVEKFEVDLRRRQFADASMEIAGAVFVSSRMASDPNVLMSSMSAIDVFPRFATDQPYAAGQPGFEGFVRRIEKKGIYELCRGRHPNESVEALREVLCDVGRIPLEQSVAS